MGKHFSLDIRKDCLVCGGDLPSNRHRTFCSPDCRNKHHNKLNWKRHGKRHCEENRKKRGAKGPGKLQCLMCGLWYVQVCSHVVNTHKITAREYKEQFGLDVKRGRVPEWYRKVKAEITYSNGTIKNLEKGNKYWFEPGDSSAGRYRRSEETMERLRSGEKKNKIKDY